MAIDVRELRSLPLDPEIEEELCRFEDGARRFIAGEIDDDVFRVFRLNQGIYGQRQGGFNAIPGTVACVSLAPKAYSPFTCRRHDPAESNP